MKELTELKVRGEFYDADSKQWETLLEDIEHKSNHFDVRTLKEACHLLQLYEHKRAEVIGGGTDIVRRIKQKYVSELPDVLVNIKTIPDLSYIKEEKGTLKIGALTRLSDIEESSLVRTRCNIMAETAGVVGSPQIRNMATIAGSICQDPCCWYYRASKDYYHCWRKGGSDCYAKMGDNRWMFSIFGTPEGCECYAVCQSDMAITLFAIGASVRTTQRTIPMERFYTLAPLGNVLRPDEIITEIQIPTLPAGAKAKYSKFSIRKSLDHPLVSVACVADKKQAKVVIGGVFIMPYLASEVEGIIRGKKIDNNLAQEVGEIAVRNATSMSMNSWKVEVTKTMVKRTLLDLI